MYLFRGEYVQLYIDYKLNRSILAQFSAFYKGFHVVCHGLVLKVFEVEEFYDLALGSKNIDWKIWEEVSYNKVVSIYYKFSKLTYISRMPSMKATTIKTIQ